MDRAADLNLMLRAPKALKIFSYKVCPHAYTSLKDVRHALGPQEDYLETLGLGYDEEWYIKLYDGRMWRVVGALI